jgi:hypothetical protein
MNTAGGFQLILACIMALELFALTRVKPLAGLWVLMGLTLIDLWGVRIEANIFGFQVYPIDLVIVVLGATALERTAQRSTRNVPLALLILLLLVALGRGALAFGLAPSGNASRELLYLLVATAFTAAHQIPWHSIERLWTAAAVLLGIGAINFWLSNGLGTYAQDGTRALSAPQALLVAQAAILLLAHSERSHRYVGLMFLGIVFLSQQRTVWATTILMLAVLVVVPSFDGKSDTRATARKVVAAGVVAVAAAVALGPRSLASSASAAVEISTDGGTFGWRIQGWTGIVKDYLRSNGLDQLIGQPAGSGYSRLINGRLVAVTPHNMYVTILVSLGLIGLVALVLLLTKATRQARSCAVGPCAVVAGAWVFSFGYQLLLFVGVLIGAALASTPTLDRNSRAASEPDPAPRTARQT